MQKILVLGLGNTLLTDDGVGIRVIEALARQSEHTGLLDCRDGGTLGLSLLPEVEDAEGVILVDACRMGIAPGDVRVFEGDAMERQLGGKKRSAHEIAAADLMAAATLTGRRPSHSALVGIEPGSLEWGCTLTGPVQGAVDAACSAVVGLAQRWRVPEDAT